LGGGNSLQVHSDGEVDETIPTTSTSAPPIISSKPSSDSFPGSGSVRVARRRRAPRGVVCHSVGEGLTDRSNVDPLRTVQESNNSSDGYSAGQNRTVFQIFYLSIFAHIYFVIIIIVIVIIISLALLPH
jgi:hypothetical protein